jgi:hypothetical protein
MRRRFGHGSGGRRESLERIATATSPSTTATPSPRLDQVRRPDPRQSESPECFGSLTAGGPRQASGRSATSRVLPVHGSLRDQAGARLNKASDGRAAQCALRAGSDSSWVRNRRSELALASSRQGPRFADWRTSRGQIITRRPPVSSGRWCRPARAGAAGSELARKCHFRLLGAASLGQPDGPGLEGRPTLDPGQQNVRGFEQVAAGEPVATFGDPVAHVALPGLVAPRRQTEIGADTR